MIHYKIYGMHFTSDFEFVQLTPLSAEEAKELPDFTVEEGCIPEEYKLPDRRCYSMIDPHLSLVVNNTCFLLIEQGQKITYERKPGAKDANLNAYLLGWGVAVLGFQRKIPAIHCSCVADERGAILISGRSGSGKSTVTEALLAQGYGLVADDMVLVEIGADNKAYAQPAFPYQKLCRNVVIDSGVSIDEMIYIDEEKDKYLVPYKGDFPKAAVPVRAMVVLDWCEREEVTVQEITGIGKMHTCMDNLFLRALFREELYRAENVDACLKLAAAISIYKISRKKESSNVSDVVCKISEIIDF